MLALLALAFVSSVIAQTCSCSTTSCLGGICSGGTCTGSICTTSGTCGGTCFTGGGGCSSLDTCTPCSNGCDSNTGLCITTTSGDPHINGPNGEAFDVKGQAGGVYALLTSRHLAINVQVDNLATDQGPEVRYMTKAGVVIGNMSVVLDTTVHDETFLVLLNKQLQLVGAKASFGNDGQNTYEIMIDVCPGERIVIGQMFTKPEWEPASFHLNNTMYYLNVEFDIGGCHEDFGGIVGQMYQCKYASREAKFEWDPTTEESFRVPTLTTTNGVFDADAQCYAKGEYGMLLGAGQWSSSAKRGGVR